ncbi:MAG: hypothetical protein PUP93_32180 [Rhizonema sp. NSF051]|nr:hypothetical protein [Rhizonema sp. NSF051]
MNHFKFKSLAFYGTAIVAVVILFSVVTAYGTANLKAPPAIDGSYRLQAQNLPECLKASTVVLTIQQSGKYLSGSLLPAPSIKLKAAQKKPSLDGNLINQQINLEGQVPGFPNCNHSQVKIQAQVREKILAGQITLGSTPKADKFTAQQELPQQQPEKH